LRLKDKVLRLKMSETKIWQSFGRENGNGEKFVKYVYIGKVHRATFGSDRATKLFVTVK
jgi:hypothetical protein